MNKTQPVVLVVVAGFLGLLLPICIAHSKTAIWALVAKL